MLTKQSRIAPRTAVAKPLSSAVAIGTAAPFGAEGPIIVTGGALGSLLGQVVISKGLFIIEALYRRLPIGEFWHPVVGAIGFATVGVAAPRSLGVGYDAISDVLDGRLALATVAALALAKLAAWWLALASGTSGGTLAPILLMSAAFGTLAGSGLNAVLPGHDIAPGAFALVAMAATFGAATRATFTAIVFVFELTRDYDVILPLMLATVLADLVFSALSEHSLMTEKLNRRGLRVGRYYGVDPFTTTPVHRIMTAPVATLSMKASVDDARRRFVSGGHGAYPIIDPTGAVVGIVTRGDVLGEDTEGRAAVVDHASRDVVAVASSDNAITALHAMIDEGVEHVPVIDDGRLVGICTRTDLLKVREHERDHERHQPGLRVRCNGWPTENGAQDEGETSRRWRRRIQRN